MALGHRMGERAEGRQGGPGMWMLAGGRGGVRRHFGDARMMVVRRGVGGGSGRGEVRVQLGGSGRLGGEGCRHGRGEQIGVGRGQAAGKQARGVWLGRNPEGVGPGLGNHNRIWRGVLRTAEASVNRRGRRTGAGQRARRGQAVGVDRSAGFLQLGARLGAGQGPLWKVNTPSAFQNQLAIHKTTLTKKHPKRYARYFNLMQGGPQRGRNGNSRASSTRTQTRVQATHQRLPATPPKQRNKMRARRSVGMPTLISTGLHSN